MHTAYVLAIIKKNGGNDIQGEIIVSTKNHIERDILRGGIEIVQGTIFECERIAGVVTNDGQREKRKQFWIDSIQIVSSAGFLEDQ